MTSPIQSNVARSKSEEVLSEHVLFVEELTANDGESHMLQNVRLANNVNDLKGEIARKIGCLPKWQSIQVVFAGNVLDNPSRALSTYGIDNGDTIYFIRSVNEAPPPYEPGPERVPLIHTLFFKDLDGKSLTLHELPVDMKLRDVFNKLGDEKSMDVEWLRFIWSGKQLQEEKTLRHYGIMNESTIHIVGRLRGGS